MLVEQIKQELLNQGKKTDDYNIDVSSENSYSITPKWYLEYKQIAKKEDILLGIDLSDREIQEIIQGQQISELEIQLLELQLGGK